MNCPFCQATIPEGAGFCEHCGKKMPRCPSCGTVITGKMRFCPKDGTKLPDSLFAVFEDKTVTWAPSQAGMEDATQIAPPLQVAPAQNQEELTERVRKPQPAAVPTPPPAFAQTPKPAFDRSAVWAAQVQEEESTLPTEVERQFRPQPAEPEKKEGKGLVIFLILLFAALAITGTVLGVMWLNGSFEEADEDDDEESSESQDADQEDADSKPGKDKSETGNKKPNKENKDDPTGASQTATETTQATQQEQPQQPQVRYEYTYEVIASDMSWEDAKITCEARGGYLAVVNTQEKYDAVCRAVDAFNRGRSEEVIYFWIGAKRPSETVSWTNAGWINGDKWDFENWYPGEPSMRDTDGTYERYLCLWSVNDGPWTFNDQRNELVRDYPSTSGKVGYICEYRTEVRE